MPGQPHPPEPAPTSTSTTSTSGTSGTAPQPRPRPQPRPALPAAQAAAVRRRNRRRAYLARHPSYVAAADHELADPLLHDALVRRFQTAEERDALGRARGYGRVLEAALLRGEARLQQLRGEEQQEEEEQQNNNNNHHHHHQEQDGSNGNHAAASSAEPAARGPPRRETNFAVARALDPEPGDADTARELWHEFLRDRFVNGLDEDFDYSLVDDDDDYDDMERQDAEDAWFENEEPAWGQDDGFLDDDDDDYGHGPRESKPLQGETGIQDF